MSTGSDVDASQLPHDSNGPRVVAVDWALAGLAAIFLALRIGCKVFRRTSLWWDDYLLIVSFVLLLVCCSIFSAAVHLGFGKHPYDTTDAEVLKIQPLLLIRAAIIMTAASWSKTSFAITLFRLKIAHMKWVLWFIIISMNLALGMGSLLSFVSCRPLRKAWNMTVDGTCWSLDTLNTYSVFSTAYSGCMDIVLAMIPWVMLWNLQMQTKEKIGVLVAISMGFIAGIFAFVKASKIRTLNQINSYTSAPFFIWDVAEVSMTIVALSIPSLRLLIQKASSTARQYYGSADNSLRTRDTKPTEASHASRTMRGSQIGGGTSVGTTSFAMSSLKKNSSPITDDSSDKSILNSPGPGGILYKTAITVTSANASNSESFEDMSPRHGEQR